jgi:hypothetical protein
MSVLYTQVLLPEVHSVVSLVQLRGLMSTQIMQLLEIKANSGVPALQSCALRLLWHCRQVFFKQLEAWLVHGQLLDRAGEFFVKRLVAREAAGEVTVGNDALPGDGGADPMEWHTGFQVVNP